MIDKTLPHPQREQRLFASTAPMIDLAKYSL
jgi:hypothetical protein